MSSMHAHTPGYRSGDRPLRVLYVEDNPLDYDLARHALEHSEPSIGLVHVSTLAQALQALKNPEEFDVALLDVHLPDGCGLELLAHIREQHWPLTVVVLTGVGEQETAIAALTSGADDYLAKSAQNLQRLPGILADACQRFQRDGDRSPEPLHVLHAGQDPHMIEQIRSHLNRCAPYIHLSTVPSATAALQRLAEDFQSTPFDALMIDEQALDIELQTLMETLRQEHHPDLPLILTSARNDELLAVHSLRLGINAYIARQPGYLNQLPSTLRQVVHQVELVRERATLEQTSQHLGLILDSSPVVLYTLKVNNGQVTLTWVSGNIDRVLGFCTADVMQPGWLQHHLSAVASSQILENFAATAKPTSRLAQDFRLRDQSGVEHWIHNELRILKSHVSGEIELVGAWQNISEAKQSELLRETRNVVLDRVLNNHPLEDILTDIAERLERIHPQMHVFIMLRERRGTPLQLIAAPSVPGDFAGFMRSLEPGVGKSSSGTAAALGEPVIVTNLRSHPNWKSQAQRPELQNLQACWVYPIRDDHKQVIGTFGIYAMEARGPSQQERTCINEFASITSLAVVRIRAEITLRQSAVVFDSTREAILVTDLTPKILTVNRAYTEITGYSEDELIGENPNLLKSGRQLPDFYQTMWEALNTGGSWQGEVWNRRKSGELFPALLSISIVRDRTGAPTHYIGVLTDLTQLRRSEAQVEQLAHYDPLTQLPNRLLIQSRLQNALQRAEHQKTCLAVLYVDLDRFKNVNESFGHPVGDLLLAELAKRLQQRLRRDDTLGRLGGDEFMIVLENLSHADDAGRVARTIMELLEQPFQLNGGNEVYIGASIGISVYPANGSTATELIQQADAAMYQAKDKGRNTYHFYIPALTETANARLTLESRLRRALQHEEFLLYYQPQVNARSGELVGCEALVRWNSPDEGLVSPEKFIPLCEETGLINALGEWVFHHACLQAAHWQQKYGPSKLILSVNLSTQQLHQRDILQRIRNILAETGWSATQLKIEITESLLMGPTDRIGKLLHDLREQGLRLSIDDFGTGYSSLAYLKRFPIDELKIDRGFVRDLPGSVHDAEIACAIIAMARSLHLEVIAEGVETPAQRDFLAEQGCDAFQGYLFGRPLSGEDFARFAFSASPAPD